MPKSRASALVALWIVSLGAAWWVGNLDSQGAITSLRDVSEEPVATEAGTTGDVASLLAAKDAEIARLEGLLEERNRGTMRQILDQLSARRESGAEPAAPRDLRTELPSFEGWSVEAMMDLAVDLDDGKSAATIDTGFYDNFGGFWEMMLLALEIGQRGDAAVAELKAIMDAPVPDPAVNEGEAARVQRTQDFAVDMLRDMRSTEAARALIEWGKDEEHRQRALQGLDKHLRLGDVEALQPHSQEILAMVESEYRDEGGDLSAAGIAAAQLAFRFDYAPAHRYATDETLIQAGWSGMLNAAKDAHTDAAWRYLNWVAGNSENGDARRQAEVILGEW